MRGKILSSIEGADAKPVQADTLFGLRILLWALGLFLLKRVVSAAQLVRWMWIEPTTLRRSSQREQRIVQMTGAVCGAVFRPSRSGHCYERSLLLYRYLSKAGAEPRLLMGVEPRHPRTGHAWVTVDGNPIGDSEASLKDFAPIVRFGPRGSVEEIEPWMRQGEGVSGLNRGF